MYGRREAIALGLSTALAAVYLGTTAGVTHYASPSIGVPTGTTLVSNSAPSSEEVRLCSANVQNTPDMPDAEVRADVRTAARDCDLVLWQEIGEEADHRAVREVLGEGWRTSRLETRPSPISWRTARFRLAGEVREIRVSDPTPRCADGSPSYNPARWITLAPLRVRSTGQKVTVVSLHFPQRRTCRTADTRERWAQAYDATKAHLPDGPLVIGGDWNRREDAVPAMTTWHWTTRAPDSLDHIAIARTRWTVARKFTRPLNSDHALTGCVAVV